MSAMTRYNPARTPAESGEWSPTARWSPFREMARLQQEIERLFNGGLARAEGKEPMTVAAWAPAVDISEDDKEFVVKAELPEVKKEDVKVTLQDDVLTIRGERKAEKEDKGKRYHRIERFYGSFERSFSLPEAVDSSKISSDYKDGMLTIHLPKSPTAKPKAIEIKIQ